MQHANSIPDRFSISCQALKKKKKKKNMYIYINNKMLKAFTDSAEKVYAHTLS